jgi:hypothetical protein
MGCLHETWKFGLTTKYGELPFLSSQQI